MDSGVVDLSLVADYEVSYLVANDLTKDMKSNKTSKNQFTEAFLQSKVVRIIKMERSVEKKELPRLIKSAYGLQIDLSTIEEALQKLADMQYISIESSLIKYLP